MPWQSLAGFTMVTSDPPQEMLNLVVPCSPSLGQKQLIGRVPALIPKWVS
jgi:hypothetical protein